MLPRCRDTRRDAGCKAEVGMTYDVAVPTEPGINTIILDYYNHHHRAHNQTFTTAALPPNRSRSHLSYHELEQSNNLAKSSTRNTTATMSQSSNGPTVMASNVLSARDTNTVVKPSPSPEKMAEKKDTKSLDYHRQVLQSKLNGEP